MHVGTYMSLIIESFPGLRRLTVRCTQASLCVITPSFAYILPPTMALVNKIFLAFYGEGLNFALYFPAEAV